MSLWDRVKAAFTPTPTPSTGGRHRVLVLNDLAFARTLPLRSRLQGRRRGEATSCACGAPFEEVVLTTFTPDDLEAWRRWPLVVDAFRCTRCENVQLPRFLEPDEFVAIGTHSIEAVKAGRHDEAEYGFRRLAASWTRYRPALSDLATALLARANRLEDEGQCDLALLDEIEHLVRDALLLEAPPPREYLVEVLAKVMLLREQRLQAERLVRDELEAATEADLRSALEALLPFVSTRADVFDRGFRLARPVIHFQGSPAPRLDGASRDAGRRGVELLLTHAAHATTDWRGLFFAALAQRTLGGTPTDLDLLQQAAHRAPDGLEVGRELGHTLLRLQRHDEALRVAEHVATRHPDTVECLSNLALCQLLAGRAHAGAETARRALALDPADAITRNVLRRCEDVAAGRRAAPASLAALERGG